MKKFPTVSEQYAAIQAAKRVASEADKVARAEILAFVDDAKIPTWVDPSYGPYTSQAEAALAHAHARRLKMRERVQAGVARLIWLACDHCGCRLVARGMVCGLSSVTAMGQTYAACPGCGWIGYVYE